MHSSTQIINIYPPSDNKQSTCNAGFKPISVQRYISYLEKGAEGGANINEK